MCERESCHPLLAKGASRSLSSSPTMHDADTPTTRTQRTPDGTCPRLLSLLSDEVLPAPNTNSSLPSPSPELVTVRELGKCGSQITPRALLCLRKSQRSMASGELKRPLASANQDGGRAPRSTSHCQGPWGSSACSPKFKERSLQLSSRLKKKGGRGRKQRSNNTIHRSQEVAPKAALPTPVKFAI